LLCLREGIAVTQHKREIVWHQCDFCELEIIDEPVSVLFFEHTGYTYGGGGVVGIDILALSHEPTHEHICKTCAQKALFNASKTLPEWKHMLRAKAIIKDLLCWYDDGNREMRDLDRIRDAASDLFGNQ
jgi:hypothetical protein